MNWNLSFTEQERKEVLWLLDREIEEMREGWQEGSMTQFKILEGLRGKIQREGEKA